MGLPIPNYTRDLQLAETGLQNQVLTWNSVNYSCLPAVSTYMLDLGDGGFAEIQSMTFKIRRELFSNNVYPQSQETLTFDGITYRIQRVNKSPTQAFLTLTCVDDSFTA